jgi:GNAT superfamily N-acetyltransferase
MVIRRCTEIDVPQIFSIINDAAQAYKSVIPADCWHEPYMPLQHLHDEIADGVGFWGCEKDRELIGVLGLQSRGDVDLIRHAYVKTAYRGQGIGQALLRHAESASTRPILIGTWAAATWAIRFYCRNGYRVLPDEEGSSLLRRYWNIPPRQAEVSVVLAESRDRNGT